MEVLDLPGKVWLEGKVDPRDIKVNYRKKSLLLHPDKCKHPRATDAFEMLKKAESELMDDSKRAWLMGVVGEARINALKKKGYNVKPGSSALPQIPTFEKDPVAAGELAVAIKIATRQLLVDQGSRDSLRMKNEVERKAQEVTALAEEKKRKAEFDKAWEEVVQALIVMLTSDGAAKKKKRKQDADVLG
ncbi:hypothetical protein HDU96_007563 [Phlyctochytrium bullatum]|nr:hypothetical protein HDU96_007563 [Phlyctochytrium bullatum]